MGAIQKVEQDCFMFYEKWADIYADSKGQKEMHDRKEGVPKDPDFLIYILLNLPFKIGYGAVPLILNSNLLD
uniref:Transposase n=1 Tax=Steinernema glaseri TaxID=37863 RepID=A0A1I8AJK8_9BILA